jgi:hypothetical protein
MASILDTNNVCGQEKHSEPDQDFAIKDRKCEAGMIVVPFFLSMSCTVLAESGPRPRVVEKQQTLESQCRNLLDIESNKLVLKISQ